jgi:AcrR family transcriptional regulator
MTLPASDRPAVGLRERKKARTRAAIQDHALRLFRAQGYDGTTVEQIAEAAEVSPSTFFRYFPTKEDVVTYDAFDPTFIEAFRSQPAELGAVEALRRAIRTALARVPTAELDLQLEREALIRSVPELRGRMLDEFVRTLQLVADLIAERTGRPAGDPEVRAMSGAVIGIAIGAWIGREDAHHTADYFTAVDVGLAQLERGFSL